MLVNVLYCETNFTAKKTIWTALFQMFRNFYFIMLGLNDEMLAFDDFLHTRRKF